MTGEKIRSLRRDHKPSKEDGDVLEPCEEEATAALGGAFTGGRSGPGGSGKGGKACHKIFSHHHRLQLKAPAVPGPGVPAPPQHNAVTATCPAPACLGGSNPALVADGGGCPSLYPVHECVFKGDVRRLSSLIRTHNIGQKDNHGNTPLHLAVMLGNKECAHLLLAHNAPVKVKNAQGWSPLAEAISYGDRQMITALLRKLKQQSRESVGEKRPRLLKALKELGDFYLELHWDFQSWVPLLSRILPSDACKIYKQGINIRGQKGCWIPLELHLETDVICVWERKPSPGALEPMLLRAMLLLPEPSLKTNIHPPFQGCLLFGRLVHAPPVPMSFQSCEVSPTHIGIHLFQTSLYPSLPGYPEGRSEKWNNR